MKHIAILAALALSGCTAYQNMMPYQPVTVKSDLGAGIPCTLSNDRGTWHAVTPATVVVRKSPEPLTITCTPPGRTATVILQGPNYNGHINTPFELVR